MENTTRGVAEKVKKMEAPAEGEGNGERDSCTEFGTNSRIDSVSEGRSNGVGIFETDSETVFEDDEGRT